MAKVNFKNGKSITVTDGKLWGYDISKYGRENGKVDYRAMIEAFTEGCLILNNTLINKADDWETYNGEDHYIYRTDEAGEEWEEGTPEFDACDEYTEDVRYYDIFQYFIIDERAAEYLREFTDEIIYYSDDLDVYLLGVTHLGTGWDYVLTDYDIEE